MLNQSLDLKKSQKNLHNRDLENPECTKKEGSKNLNQRHHPFNRYRISNLACVFNILPDISVPSMSISRTSSQSVSLRPIKRNVSFFCLDLQRRPLISILFLEAIFLQASKGSKRAKCHHQAGLDGLEANRRNTQWGHSLLAETSENKKDNCGC